MRAQETLWPRHPLPGTRPDRRRGSRRGLRCHGSRFTAMFLGLLIVLAAAVAARAQSPTFDKLECYKARERARLSATVDLSSFAFAADTGCRVKVQARSFCRPAHSDVTDASGPLRPITGRSLSSVFACYKIRCPRTAISVPRITDLFGAHDFVSLRQNLLCVPALIGEPFALTLQLNSSVSLAALEFDVQIVDRSTGYFAGSRANVECNRSDQLRASTLAVFSDGSRGPGILSASLVDAIDGIAAQASLVTCRFLSLRDVAPDASDFVITVLDATDTQFNPRMDAGVVILSIVPE